MAAITTYLTNELAAIDGAQPFKGTKVGKLLQLSSAVEMHAESYAGEPFFQKSFAV